MLSDKALCYLLITGTCLILACAGCETAAPKADQIQPQQQTVTTEVPQAPAPEKLPSQPPVTGSAALKFNTGDSATYKVTTEAKQSVKWEGTVPQDFKGGTNHNMVEMTYNQQVQSVDENGNAVLKITVEALKYLSMRKDELYMNFDNSNVKDPNDPLALLIGQSYTIEMAPTGKVTKVLELADAQTQRVGTQLLEVPHPLEPACGDVDGVTLFEQLLRGLLADARRRARDQNRVHGCSPSPGRRRGRVTV